MPQAHPQSSWYGWPLTLSFVFAWCKMDIKSQAKELYSELRCSDNDAESNDEKLCQAKQYIQQHLYQAKPGERFQFAEFASIISDSAAMPYFSPNKASTAFQNLEIYLILILNSPWKSEYKTLRKYSGFFQSKIEAHLQNATSIFKLVGYSETKDGILTLVRRINKDIVLAVAFECLVAAEECVIINAAHQSGDPGISYAHIVRVRSSHSGNVEQLANLVRKDLPYNSDHMVKDRRGEPDMHTDTPTPGNVKLHIPDKTVHSSGNIPYADEDTAERPDLREATFEEHCMASLRLLQEDVAIPKLKPHHVTKGGSDEWSFVRDGLQNKFGEDYFKGPRGDVLKGDELIDPEVAEKDLRPVMQPPRPHGPSNRDSGYPDSYAPPIYYPPTADTGYESQLASKVAASSTLYAKVVPPSDLTHGPPGHYTRSRDMSRGNEATYLHPVSGEDVHNIGVRNMTPLPHTQGSIYPELPSEIIQGNRTHPQLLTREPSHIPSSGRKTFPTSPPRTPDNATNKRHLSKSLSLKSPTEATSRQSNFNARPLPNHPSVVMKDFVTEQNYNTAPPYGTSRSAPIARRDAAAVLQPRFQRQLSSERTIGWGCQFCTLMNSSEVQVCSSCGKSRSSNTSSDIGITTKKCSVCTYNNSPGASRCSICDSDQLYGVQSAV
ncbi:uncharacterized protein LOC117337200 [Pecten maximus]|uniref:uncharacterized protein LOC117337200 n=1 Tax=Pecten maximus TaxID=6579 RepID=UPI0014589C53|nr:uncharacterized protein LOC117337200 [Pecten maximus]XP_033753943.1 uncharacterized protein LOC117337200 [Pecten maximus]XP_033753944.1 uncharacterized protein LOC117337200 [Pecten maximus]XP_033753945.1 uncharacterized protein LOC117337200 [Pecten maximus]XP_033753946.1 uncharacterized protein LOC117337200 [Pecten maximus]XP_033753947.1 uncharacterized protein LOC117337200 [Pecten maximus]